MPVLQLELQDLSATQKLGALLADGLRAGDVISLSGPLGAGKSALARSIIVSAKFTDDYHLTNTNFARVGGVNLKELNMLEVDFCKLLSFSLFTPVAIFNKYWKTIHSLAENIEDDEEE